MPAPMETVDYLVVGAGISGLSFANAIRTQQPDATCLIIERDQEPGGYCKTIIQDGFTWDYSGHFFHFRDPDIEAWLRARLPGQDIRTVTKRSQIRYKRRDIDFPFQKNIHQLPQDDFIDALYDLYFRDEQDNTDAPISFQTMLYQKFGKSIAQQFLIPYNEKLYATTLDNLDVDAMGRFFPHANVSDIIRNMRQSDNASYNTTFTYPRGGAIQYIHALLHDLPASIQSYGEALEAVDLATRTATTSHRRLRYQHLVSSAPLNQLAATCSIAHDPSVFSWNQVLVFNLGFDRKGPRNVHWIYFPDRNLRFYRVGFYDNIMDDDRMSLYVEIGMAPNEIFDINAERTRVLTDLSREHILTEQQLISHHSVVMDPAYVHITRASRALCDEIRPLLHTGGVHSIGRYGSWTYCSIEDNIVQARTLAATLASSTT